MDLSSSVAAQVPAAAMRLRRAAEDEPQPELEPDVEVLAQRQRVEVAQALQDAVLAGDRGDFDGARGRLAEQVSKIKASPVETPVSAGLVLELEDAESRMQSRSAWERGGGAEVRDAMQMHRMQRCTNMSPALPMSGRAAKCSKAMYSTGVQRSWLSKG
eukprot:SRR837773.10169.p1 GENE.SRR837773.10169~~SRR837773.10169.p1  ORF type:complete len:169 (-),score=61.82 SRR837773.10169:18-494(-)